jgi:hypothetical protein
VRGCHEARHAHHNETDEGEGGIVRRATRIMARWMGARGHHEARHAHHGETDEGKGCQAGAWCTLWTPVISQKICCQRLIFGA